MSDHGEAEFFHFSGKMSADKEETFVRLLDEYVALEIVKWYCGQRMMCCGDVRPFLYFCIGLEEKLTVQNVKRLFHECKALYINEAINLESLIYMTTDKHGRIGTRFIR